MNKVYKMLFSWFDIIIHLPVEGVGTCTPVQMFGKSLPLQTLITVTVYMVQN